MMNDCDKMENMRGKRYRLPRKKTRLEKWLIVICVLLMLILTAMAIFTVIALHSNIFKEKSRAKPDTVCNITVCPIEDSQFSAIKEEKKLQNVCNSQPCVQEAAAIIKKIDFSIPPCKNFYRFACGNYMKNSIPNRLDYTRDVTSDMETEVNRRIRRLLESLNQTRRWENELKMKTFHKSCMDMRKKDLSTRNIVENILRHLQLEEWLPSQHQTASMTLEEKLAIVMAHGARNPLFHVEYEGMNTVMLQETRTILQEEYLLSDENNNLAVDEYRRLMIEVFTRLGFSNTVAENEVESVLEFEMSIAEIARDHTDDAYTLLELKQLEGVLPWFKWLPFFQHLYSYLEKVGYKAEGINVVLQSPGYMEELIQLLQDTNPKIVESYVMWSFLFRFLHIFDISLAKHYHTLNFLVNPKIKDLATTDWESCVLLTKNRFREPLNHHYAKEVISDIILKKVEEIDKDMTHSFDKLMQSERWKPFYDSKAWKEREELSLNIPYKDINVSERPAKIFPQMSLSDDFIANVFQIERKIVTNSVITGSPQDFFSSEDRLAIRPLYEDITYELPLGVFQSPYITAEIPSYLSYAALGFPLAGKLSRYFQDIKNLNEIKPTESTNSSSRETNCFETEYLEFLARMQIDAETNTSSILNEYLLSNVGIRLAFTAYKMHAKSHGIEDKLPGLEFEPDQLFFIHHAGLMCETWTEETVKKYLQNGRSPAEFSVNGALRNSEEFARVFNCPAGSNMNPSIKCLI